MADLISINLPLKNYPDTVHQKIATILNVDTSNINVVDSRPDQGLYLLAPDLTADLDIYGWIRGVVVDIEVGKIICQSYGYIPLVESDVVPLTSVFNQESKDDKSLTFKDTNNNVHHLLPDTWSIEQHHEGFTLRVFKHKGIVYFSTMSKLDFSKSKWGTSKLFSEIYSSLNGPKAEDIFPYPGDYSPFVHIFLVCHPDILNVYHGVFGPFYPSLPPPNRGMMTDLQPEEESERTVTPDLTVSYPGYIVYSGVKTMFYQSNNPYSTNVDWVLWNPSAIQWPTITLHNTMSSIRSGAVDVHNANIHLRYGAYLPWNDVGTDMRLGTGESLIIRHTTPHGTTLYHVRSPAYAWRALIRNENTNLILQFYYLITDSLEQPRGLSMTEFLKKYPSFEKYDINSVISALEKTPLILWPTLTPSLTPISSILGSSTIPLPLPLPQNDPLSLIKTQDDRLYQVWAALIMSVPLHHQLMIAKLLPTFYENKGKVIRYIIETSLSGRQFDIEKEKRLWQLIKESRNLTTLRGDFDNQVKMLVDKEYGDSLYRLVRDMNKAKMLEQKSLQQKK